MVSSAQAAMDGKNLSIIHWFTSGMLATLWTARTSTALSSTSMMRSESLASTSLVCLDAVRQVSLRLSTCSSSTARNVCSKIAHQSRILHLRCWCKTSDVVASQMVAVWGIEPRVVAVTLQAAMIAHAVANGPWTPRITSIATRPFLINQRHSTPIRIKFSGRQDRNQLTLASHSRHNRVTLRTVGRMTLTQESLISSEESPSFQTRNRITSRLLILMADWLSYKTSVRCSTDRVHLISHSRDQLLITARDLSLTPRWSYLDTQLQMYRKVHHLCWRKQRKCSATLK